MPSDIYYRIYFFYETMSGSTLIVGKIIVQVGVERDARSFWWGVGFVLTNPINPHCSVDVLEPREKTRAQ